MARIKEEDIDYLRERADVVEVVSGYSHLKKAGPNTYKGLCPFHSEKTPSFTVDAVKGLYHCFGCGAGGNIYHFIEKAENLPFPEAVEWLARKTGVTLHYEEARPGQAAATGLKARLLQANEAAARFWHEQLFTSDEATEARRYLERRGFGAETAGRWQLGYAPGRSALCKHLLGQGFTQDEIVKADLGRMSDRGGGLYDTFRMRITFPTWNLQGDVVGFGARALGDQQPKYLNTGETPVFSKSRVMYGLNRAKSAISRGAALVVEGYTDVIALHEAGVTEAVATNGVALGDAHFEQLKKFTSRAVLMFDADEAGRNATERGFGLHHRIGMEVLVAPLPPGRDPADVVKEDGPDAIRKIIEAAQPLLEFKLEQTLSKLPLDTPEARSSAVNAAVEVLGWHPDPIARHEYAFMAARRIGVDVEMVQRALVERPGGVGTTGGTTERQHDRRLPGHVKVEREALQLLLTRPHEAGAWSRGVLEEHFTSSARRELYRHAKAAADASTPLDPAALAGRLSADSLSLMSELAVGMTGEGEEDLRSRAREIFMRLRVFSLEREIKKRRDTLQDMNPVDDPKGHDELFTELVGLEANRRDLLRQLRGAA